MKRELTKRETVLLAVLGVLLAGLVYYRFILTPIHDQILSLQTETGSEQQLIDAAAPRLAKMQSMKKELEELKASGNARALPEYDNVRGLMDELHVIMASAQEYTLNFNSTVESDSIVRRPINMTFTAGTYGAARAIIDKLHESRYTNQITDLAYTLDDDSSAVEVKLTVTYYELDPNPPAPTAAADTASAG